MKLSPSYTRKISRLVGLMGVLIALLMLAGCRDRGPAVTPTAARSDAQNESLPETESIAAVEPESGGSVRLRDGADVAIPSQALSASATVTLRVDAAPPEAPSPRSQLGRAYEFALDGADLTGVALLRLPVPPDVSVEDYDFAPYRWTGKAWERLNGRLTPEGIQFGVNTPGLFALQGEWKQADATLTLARGEMTRQVAGGVALVPLTVAGQYRYSALPELTGEYVPARLLLKQDTSGGLGRITGDESLDATVDTAELRFKPDPGSAQARIDFSHTFQLDPTQLDLAPGAATRFYTVLQVNDSAAPTTRTSTAVEYAQVLPIQIVGKEVVRPQLVNEGQVNLRWNVLLNGNPLTQVPASDIRLPLDPLLAQGGLGDYRIMLEAESNGAWAPVSNDVTVQLALRPTPTYPPGQEPAGTAVAFVSPTPGTPQPGGPVPPTPTRRPRPSGGQPGELAATATFTPTVPPMTPTATRSAAESVFWAEKYNLAANECTVIHWQVNNVISVFYQGAGVTGNEFRRECPAQTTTYTLRVNTASGSRDYTLTLIVAAPEQVAIEFAPDTSRIAKGQCATLTWRVTNVAEVYLNNQAVAGESSQEVCPTTTTNYDLRVVGTDGTQTTKRVTIIVVSTAVAYQFWAEQYTLPPNGCTNLHWRVENVQAVMLDGEGVEGIGTKSECPEGTQLYLLEITGQDGTGISDQIILVGEDPQLQTNEVVAQGVVNQVTQVADLDSTTLGDQPGYRLTIDGLRTLATNDASWSQVAVSLNVPLALAESGDGGPVDWPISAQQPVEFRAVCQNQACSIVPGSRSYLYLRGG
jgi:hypothetical protein